MGGTTRFDCYPSDFLNGVIGLTGDQIAAYTIVMMLQYDRGAPVAYIGKERELQVRAGLSKSCLSKALQKLIEIGKLSLIDGCLSNGRTAKELQKISERLKKNVENAQAGGIATKIKWDGLRENNDTKPNEISEGAMPIGLADAMPIGIASAEPDDRPLARLTRGNLRPSPSPPEEKRTLRVPKEPTHGTRLLADWRPNADGIAFAVLEIGPGAVERAIEEFRDYWVSIPGAKGRKITWDGTWRSRVRALADRNKKPAVQRLYDSAL